MSPLTSAPPQINSSPEKEGKVKVRQCGVGYTSPPLLGGGALQNDALPALAVLVALFGKEGRTSGVLEDFSDAFVGFGAAFEVVSGADLLLDFFALCYAG